MRPPLQPLAFVLSLALHAGALGGVVLLAGDDPPLPLAVVDIDLVPAAVFVAGDEPDGAPRAPVGSLIREPSPSARGAFKPRSGRPRAASTEVAAAAPLSETVKSSRSGAPPQLAAASPRAQRAIPAPGPRPDSGLESQAGRAAARRRNEASRKPSAASAASRTDSTGSEVALLAPPSAAAAGGALAPEGPRVTAASLANIRPRYPESARRAGIEGRVVLRVTVTAGGSSEAVVVEQSSGHALLDRSALAAVRRWRFLPARRGGIVVSSEIAIPILFRLEDGKP
jgi:protein TonB